MPKKGVHHFQERVDVSLVGVFNKVQGEAGRGSFPMVVPLHGYGRSDQNLPSILIRLTIVTLVPE